MIKHVATAFTAALGCCAWSAAVAAKSFNLEKPHVLGQLIVAVKPDVKGFEAASLLAHYGAHTVHVFRTHGARLLAFDSLDDVLLMNRAKALAAEPEILYVEANAILKADETLPNDPNFGDLYGLKNTGANGGVAGADIRATEAWDITTGSKSVLVGVIDTGIDYTHPDIAPNYWTNPGETGLDASGKDKSNNGIDDDRNGFVDDWHGWNFDGNNNNPMDDNQHGTHVTGTIGAHGNDGIGVVGVNWNVSVVAIKFLSSTGSGTLDNAVKAIEYATTIGVTLMSNSWGGGGFSDTMQAAIKAAGDKGILFVAAAGNDAADNDATPHYPGSYPLDNVVSVAATDNKDAMASFSDWGRTTVHLAAPGVDILSSVPGAKYAKLSGTSMATPHVSGAAALIKAAYPNATYQQLKARLVNTVDPIPALATKIISGGRLNLANALANDTVPPGLVHDLQVAGVGTTSVTVQFGAAGDDGDQGVARRYDVRFADQPIDSDAAFNAATHANALVSIDASNVVRAVVSNLAFNARGYLAVKAIDKVGNVGPLSVSVPFAVTEVVKVYENLAASMDHTKAEGTWGLENDTTRNKTVYSDSPGALYKENSNFALTLDAIPLTSPQVTLTFQNWMDLEAGYDFGYVELSKDGGSTWVQVDKLTGTVGWTQKSYDLSAALAGATSARLRFRITSDYSINKDGWKIDDIALYAPK